MLLYYVKLSFRKSVPGYPLLTIYKVIFFLHPVPHYTLLSPPLISATLMGGCLVILL